MTGIDFAREYIYICILAMSLGKQRDNYNLKSYRHCNNMSCVNFAGYVGHVTIFSWMFTIVCCIVVVFGLGLALGLDFMSGW